MSTLSKLTRICEILNQYGPHCLIVVEHDVLLLMLDPKKIPVSTEDQAVLESLGAHIDEQFQCWKVYC
jgi:hypothetical protein